jgi:hypothetical protein
MRVLFVLLALASPAYATGFCENTPRHVGPPKFVHEADGVFALPFTQDWCDEKDGVEKRGVVSGVELRDATGVKAVLATAGAVKRLEAMGETVDTVKSIDAELKARGFRPLVKKTAACTVRTAWQNEKDPSNGWPAGKLGVDVVAGKQKVASVEIGIAARKRRGDVVIAAHFAKPKVLVFARLPTCSGPPPGYFGPDDGGDCYTEDEPVIRVLDAAACF